MTRAEGESREPSGNVDMQSKWARHRDQANSASRSASEDEDDELEKAYQQKVNTKKADDDIFGLDKILS